eukprot:621456-Prorocentrum_minimum.AAC.1
MSVPVYTGSARSSSLMIGCGASVLASDWLRGGLSVRRLQPRREPVLRELRLQRLQPPPQLGQHGGAIRGHGGRTRGAVVPNRFRRQPRPVRACRCLP